MVNEVFCILRLICNRSNAFRPRLACFLALLFSVTFLSRSIDAHNSSFWRPRLRAAQREADTRSLELGIPVEVALLNGESHSYQIALTADQYLQVEVARRGVDVIMELFDPAGTKLTEVDNARVKQGSELLTFIADVLGNYRIQISMAEKNAPAGRYEVKVIALKAPTADERSLEEARRLSEDSRKLRKKGKYDEAVPLVKPPTAN